MFFEGLMERKYTLNRILISQMPVSAEFIYTRMHFYQFELQYDSEIACERTQDKILKAESVYYIF